MLCMLIMWQKQFISFSFALQMDLRIAINELLLLRFHIKSALQGSQSMAAWYEAQSDVQPAASGGMCRILLENTLLRYVLH